MNVRKFNNLTHADCALPSLPDTTTGYHSACYRSFTAVRSAYKELYDDHPKNSPLPATAEPDDSISSVSADRRSMRSDNPVKLIDSSSRIFNKICLFCKSANKKYKEQKQRLIQVNIQQYDDQTDERYSPFQRNVIKYAEILKDDEMLSEMKFVDAVAKEVVYHNICRVRYQTKAEAMAPKDEKSAGSSPWHRDREAHTGAYNVVCKFVEQRIIENKEFHFSLTLPRCI